jgi:hypothetical protein
VLRGRRNECEGLDRLLDAVRLGRSSAQVGARRGGVGKTGAAGIRRRAGIGLGRLRGPQRDALREAFGLEDGGARDHFLVAVAVLSLLADAAEVCPLVCVIDDAQCSSKPLAGAGVRRAAPSG